MKRKLPRVETAILAVAMTVVALQVVWAFTVPGEGARNGRESASVITAATDGPAAVLWADSLTVMDEALRRGDVALARKARYRAYLEARHSRSVDGLLATGHVAMRLRYVVPDRPTMEAQAREAFVEALLRARDQDSLNGVLAATEGFRTLQDRRLVAQGVRVAREMVRDNPSAQSPVAALVEQSATSPE